MRRYLPKLTGLKSFADKLLSLPWRPRQANPCGKSLDALFYDLATARYSTPAKALEELTDLVQFSNVTPPLPEGWRLIMLGSELVVRAPDGDIQPGSMFCVRGREREDTTSRPELESDMPVMQLTVCKIMDRLKWDHLSSPEIERRLKGDYKNEWVTECTVTGANPKAPPERSTIDRARHRRRQH